MGDFFGWRLAATTALFGRVTLQIHKCHLTVICAGELTSLQALLSHIPVFLLIAGSQVALCVFDLKACFLLHRLGQHLCAGLQGATAGSSDVSLHWNFTWLDRYTAAQCVTVLRVCQEKCV